MSARQPQRGLKFYPGAHRYRLDGEFVPGVTTILGVLNKPALVKWAATSVAEYVADNREAIEHLYAAGRGPMIGALKETPWQRSRDAADRGTSLHDIAEQIVRGEEADVPEELVPVVEHALQFMDDWRIEPVLIETAVASREHRYAGKLDLVARYTDPRDLSTGVGIFDWKSGKRIYPEACFQMNAYGHAEFYGENGDEHSVAELGIGAAFGVHIRADGYDVNPLPYSAAIFDEFLTIRRAYDIQKRAEGNWREPGSGYVGLPVRTEPAWEATA